MRVLLASGFFWPKTTGSSHFAASTAARIVAAGHEVVVVTTAHPGFPTEQMRDGYRIVRLPTRTLSPGRIAFNYELPFAIGPTSVLRLFKLIEAFKPDLIHQHGHFFDVSWMTCMLGALMRVPRVVTVHTMLTHDHQQLRRVVELGDRLLNRPINSLGCPTWVVTDSRIKQYVQDTYKPPHQRVVYIPIGIDPTVFVGGNQERIRNRHHLGNAPVILSLGHVIPLRDRVALVQALPAVRKRIPGVKLVVVGQVYTDAFLGEARRLGVDDAVVVTGRVEHGEIRDYIAASTVECHDLNGIGLGTTSFEVMSTGTPVVARVADDNFPDLDLANLPDLGFIDSASPETIASALISLLHSGPAREKVAAAQRSFVHTYFTLDRVTKAYLDLYSSVTKSKRIFRA